MRFLTCARQTSYVKWPNTSKKEKIKKKEKEKEKTKFVSSKFELQDLEFFNQVLCWTKYIYSLKLLTQ